MNTAETVPLQRLVEANSDQINAADIMGEPITATIEGYKIKPGDKQVIELKLSGQDKPWRPCLTIRRILVNVWGHYTDWPGHALTLYCDQSVVYGGEKVGGIRVSHMDGISEAKHIMIKKNKKSYMEYVVQPLTLNTAPAWDYETIMHALGDCADAETFITLKTAARTVYKSATKEQQAALTAAIKAASEQ